ncbi:uncharacterized protein [Halyomorpha halys]|uniref:uncharacterized protein n=1 Tax=Halyomorpha halys TaxID=286706 RepID=UPI0006D4E1D2|nr:uncharacterized protein LOC106689980 [Halyomorpha halys]
MLIEQRNIQLRKEETSLPIPQISLNLRVKYPDAVVLGVDSIQRTSDCWHEKKGEDINGDIHFGLQLMTLVLPYLEVDGRNMSAFVRIRDNSVHLSYTLHVAGEKCHIKLNELKIEKLGNVEFRASRPEYDGSDLDLFLESEVMQAFNNILEANFFIIQASFQAYCKDMDFQTEDHGQ